MGRDSKRTTSKQQETWVTKWQKKMKKKGGNWRGKQITDKRSCKACPPVHTHPFQLFTAPLVKKRCKEILGKSCKNRQRSWDSWDRGCCHTQPKRDGDFPLFMVDDLHALLLMHSSSFHAVRPLTRWMLIDSGIQTDRCQCHT